MTDRSLTRATFDDCVPDYDHLLSRGLAITGEGRDYFAEGRIKWLAGCIRQLQEQVRVVMDFGCGDGSSVPYLFNLLRAHLVIGVDTSRKSVDLARQKYTSEHTLFSLLDDYYPHEQADLAYCNGVFHHIQLSDRAAAVEYVYNALRPGGLFAFWENNPWNPGAMYVMRQLPFDREAIVLTPPTSRQLLQAGGFQVLRTDFLFVFPRVLSVMRSIESAMAKLPLGAQYQVLCRKL